MEAMDACVSPSPCTFLDESPAGISSRRRQSDIRRLKVLSNTSSFSDAMKKHSRSRNATHLCSVCFGDEVSSTADAGNTMEIVLHSQALYPTRRLVRSVSTPTAWKGGLFCTCNINKFYISSNNNSTTNETSVVKSDAEPMLHESKEEMSINVTDIKTQASVVPLADNERTGASEGLSVASTVTEKVDVDVEVVVEEHKQKNTIPHSRPSKGIALPRANSESILLLKDPCPPHGTMSIIGRRREMEDTVAAVPSFISLSKPTVPSHNGLTGFTAPTPTPLHFFGVYDGHGGSQVSTYCKNRFHEALAEELGDAASSTRDLSYWNKVMSACFMKMDMAVGGMCPNGGCSSNGDVQMISDCCQDPVAPENVGSTAVVAVVSPTQVVIANCGDSRAVLCRGGKAIPLSNDHKPEREDELGRIEAAGGRVIYWNGYRVGGFLAMSRALGDRFLKKYVISEPEVTCTERTHEDECLILASDGLWDVLSNDTVCEVARKCLAGFRPHRSKGITEDTPVGAAAALLTKLALGRGSGDNISVVVIDLKERRNRNR